MTTQDDLSYDKNKLIVSDSEAIVAAAIFDTGLTDEFFNYADARVKKRLSPRRYEHSKSVSETAVKLAKIYAADIRQARIAGLLHDWDKCYDNETLCVRARELGVELPAEAHKTMPGLLHGLTAAVALRQEFPELDACVVQAIARHTTGEIDMTDLDMVVYIADVIEPKRPYKTTDTLRESVGGLSLEALFFITYKHVVMHLIEKDYRVHPDTIRIWNHYAERIRERKDEKGIL